MCNFMLEDAKQTNRCERHIVWELEDKNDSAFFCDKLLDILGAMDGIILQKDNKSSDNVLVHCAMGVSRSVTLCATWIMTRQRRSLQDTMDMIRLVRPEAMPNMGFIATLRALEASDYDIEKARKRLGQTEKLTV